jgi:integrase/recombinase XerD
VPVESFETDSKRMMIRIERTKAGVDRDVPLSQKLLKTLREYYRRMQPKPYLFPGTVNNWRADKPITPKVIW